MKGITSCRLGERITLLQASFPASRVFELLLTKVTWLMFRRPETLEQVRDFLNGNEELPGGGGKPRLYCSSRLWIRKNPGDTEQGKDGKPLPPDGQGPKILLRRFAAELSEQIDGRAPLVFWTDQYNEYLISNDQGGQYFCDSPDRLAVTDDSDDIVPSKFHSLREYLFRASNMLVKLFTPET